MEDSSGSTTLFKLPSTPEDPSKAILQGIEAVLSIAALVPRDIRYLGHGTTVATNAVIERRWAKTALLTTKGFRDVIEIRRQQRPDTYDLDVEKPPQIASRDLRREVPERTLVDGTIERSVNHEEVTDILRDLADAEVEAVAICFIHAYTNPRSEHDVRALVAKHLPSATVTISSDVLPEFREYPRVSTTLVNASLQPVMSRYLSNLEAATRSKGFPSPRILMSHGGVVSTGSAGQEPVRTLVSGPSAGVIGATAVCAIAGFRNILTFDMGGTSTDVCLVVDGIPAMTREKEVAGYPVRTPMMDVHSIGAGGGSVASVDEGGFLHVGPESAGATPGPACYGLGGSRPTVADANALLGRLNPGGLLNGRMPLHIDRAEAAIERFIATRLGVSPIDASRSVLRIVNANIVKAIRLISVERGHDPRDFALVAFGGAGPAHATALAAELGFRTVLIPPSPGILCALGLLVADAQTEFSRTQMHRVDEHALLTAGQIFDDLERRALDWLAVEAAGYAWSVERMVDMRYVGQSFELTVHLGDVKTLELANVLDRFHAEHERTYGHYSGAPAEFVTFRVRARGVVPKPNFAAKPSGRSGPPRPTGRRLVTFDDAVQCLTYDRDSLQAGEPLHGPAIVEAMDSTIVVPPDWRATLDAHQIVHLEVSRS